MQIFEFPTWESGRKQRLVIEEGRVSCPLRGDIDVETCFACAALISILGDGEPVYVSCSPSIGTRLIGRS